MVNLNVNASELKGYKLAIVSADGKKVTPFAELDFVAYKTDKAQGYNLLRVGNAFSGDVIAMTADKHSINMKGGLYAKKAVDKPVVEFDKAGKLL